MSLSPVWKVNGLDLTRYPYGTVFDGPDYGSPDMTVDVLLSLLGYGDVEVILHTGNRTLSLPIMIEGTDLAETAAAERDLWLAVSEGRGEVYCDPGDGLAAPMVWDVFPGQMSLTRTDAAEMANIRLYTLTFRALPYSRSAVLTEVAALVTGTDVTVVDNGSSTTDWQALNASISVVSGAVQSSAAPNPITSPLVWHTLIRTGTIDVSTTKFIQIDWAVTGGDPKDVPRVSSDGQYLTPIGTRPAAAAGFTGSVFLVPPGYSSLADITIECLTYAAVAGTTQTFRIDNITRTNKAPNSGTTRQLSRAWTVDGAAPTEGAITLEHETSSLGPALIYTRPDPKVGYSPALRPYLVSSPAGTPDAALVSGAYNDPGDPMEYMVPFSTLPRGTYQLWARVKSTTGDPQTILTEIKHQIGSTVLPGAVQTRTTEVDFIGSSTWQIVCLADGLSLPANDMPLAAESYCGVTIRQTTATGGATTALDELWLLEVEQGDVTVVDCGSDSPAPGGSGNRLWITPPSVDRPRWGVFVGTEADQTDAYYPGDLAIAAYPSHRFALGLNMLFTVTSNALDASASLTYYQRWIFHAAA